MLTYRDSGVDIDAGNLLVQRIREKCPEIGGFSGLYPLGDQFLAATTDGVGTKLKLAFHMNRHDTVGIDLVAMCVNDLLAVGARPLFFLDYYATGQLNVDQAEGVLSGILEGCHQAECPLLGGETAEMPGMYQAEEYDLAGFAVGLVDRDKVLDGQQVRQGDWLIGLPSTGVHSNGFSLVRKILEYAEHPLERPRPTGSFPIGEELLTPTQIYVRHIRELRNEYEVRGIAHITGGGLEENVARLLPEGLSVALKEWEVPPLFGWLQELGGVEESEMRRTFNLGVGMVLVVSESEALKMLAAHADLIEVGRVV